MRKTIASSLAALLMMSALAPIDALAQNAAAPPTGQATPPAATATIPATAAAKRTMAMRGGKFRHRNNHRNMYWRTGTNNLRAMRPSGSAAIPATFGAAGKQRVTGASATAATINPAATGATATKGTHPKAYAGKSKQSTRHATEASKNASAKS
jgi:hypothetical protein